MPSAGYIQRRAQDLLFRAAREIQVKIKRSAPIHKLTYFPAISDKSNLSDVLNRANWYFPENGLSDAEIIIPVNSALFDSIQNISELHAPEYMENYITENKRIQIKRIEKNNELAEEINSSDGVLLWDFEQFSRIPKAIFNLNKIWVVDPNYFSMVEARNYIRLVRDTTPLDKMSDAEKLGKSNFERMVAEGKKYSKAYVFGTGPSIMKAEEFDFSDGFRIVANTVISDEKIAKHIKPHAIVFGDFVYHIGPSKYAAAFMEQLSAALEAGMYGIVRMDIMPFMVTHFPKFKKQLVGIPLHYFARPNIPNAENYFVKLSNNSLVSYMLPISSAMVDQIFILGCDGRDPKDTLIWKHAKTTHFDDKLTALRETHPSVFRDMDFKEFYEGNVRDTDEFIQYGESLGKKYYSLAPSHFPALKKRQYVKPSDIIRAQ